MTNETEIPVIMDPKFLRTPEYKTVYTNFVRGGATAYDIQITFGQLVNTVPEDQTVQELVTVIMSPGESKALLRALTTTIQLYEKQYGEIRDLQPVLEEAKKRLEASTKSGN